MSNLIEIWADKNINKPKKPLAFDQWAGQTYWIDPVMINYIDPVQMTIHCTDDIVFKVYQKKDLDEIIEKVNN